jgi:hypothetical protein
MHFFAGVEGSVHDLEVFRRTLNDLYRLLEDHPNELTKILADKGYIGFPRLAAGKVRHSPQETTAWVSQ